MIWSFADKRTTQIWNQQYVSSLDRALQRTALRKLELIHAARDIEDLRVPPGNRLEQLKGRRAGQHSVRVNDQWRLCFVWRDGGAHHVELVDYHR